MSFALSLAVRGDLEAWARENMNAIRRAERDAITEVSHAARDEFRADMRRAGLEALEKTWRADVYPKRGLANNPAGLVFSRAEYLVEAFSSGRPIRARRGDLLAVPIKGSPAEQLRNPRGPDTKVDEARRRFGELVVIPGVPGRRPPMLAAQNVGFTRTGRVTRRRTTKSGRYGSGASTVPLFYLVKDVRLGRRLNTARVMRHAERRLEARLMHALDKQLRRVAEAGAPRND